MPKMKYKVGDWIKVTDDGVTGNDNSCFLGRIGTIIKADYSSFAYKVNFGDCEGWLYACQIEDSPYGKHHQIAREICGGLDASQV